MPVPVIGGVHPNSGPISGGTTVVINGSNFTGTISVTFGGVNAAFVVNSDAQLTATSPPNGPGTVDIVVTNGDGSSQLVVQDQFLYVVPVPMVTSVFPNCGPSAGGTLVTIGGTNFTGVTEVYFGNEPAQSFQFISDNQITAVSPADSPGTVDVQVVTPNGTSATNAGDRFLFQTPPPPFVQGINPASGPTTGGTTVMISGGNFQGATAVTFGGTSATFMVNSNNQITATSPPKQAGPCDVQVTTPNGTSAVNANDVFQYVALVPAVSSVAPNSGPAGTQVLVSGSNFTNATGVTFGSTSAPYTVLSSFQIRTQAPQAGPGTVDIIVSNAQGSSSPCQGDQYLYT